MLRHSIQLIYDDIKESKSYKEDIRIMITDLDNATRKLEVWKRQWLVDDYIPEGLYIKFWGDAEYEGIKTKLSTMEAYFVEMNKVLRPSSGAEDSMKKIMAPIKRKIRKRRFLWMQRKHLQDLLGKLEKALNDLDDAAKIGWQRHFIHKDGDVDFSIVHHTGLGHLLVSLASQSFQDIEALWQDCHHAQESITAELDLDIFGTSSTKSRALELDEIAKAASERHITLTLLTRAATLEVAEMTRVRIKNAPNPEGGTTNALEDAVSRVVTGTSDICHYYAQPDFTFSVYKSEVARYGPGTGLRKSLREIQSGNPPPHFANNTLLGSKSKFRVAFELAQACLLFLRAPWFSDICSCRIRCGVPFDMRDELQYDFTLQLGKSEHQDPRWAQITKRCWGRTADGWNILTRPLRRLALLLIEATLGTTVLTATCREEGVISFITFMEGQSHSLRPRAISLDKVMSKVHRAAYKNQPYTDALKYCATKLFPQAPTDSEMRQYLTNFYWEVVSP